MLERANEEASVNEDGGLSLSSMEETLVKLNKRLNSYIDMRADGEMTEEQYLERKTAVMKDIEQMDKLILEKKIELGKKEKYVLDVNKIHERLETYVDLNGFGVSDEMIEFFVERIIRRKNDEYVWEMNLSGLPAEVNKYKIKRFNKNYADDLKDDKNFNIVKTFVISLEECEKFCKEKAHRQYRKCFWNQIT